MHLSREQLEKAYEVFNQVSGGLDSYWIINESSLKPTQDIPAKTMIGTPAGDNYESVFIEIHNMTTDRKELWERLKTTITGVDAIEWEETLHITRLQFEANADQNGKLF